MKLTLEMLKKYGACPASIERYQVAKCDTIELAVNMMQRAKLYLWCNWIIARVLNRENKIRYAIFAAKQVVNIFEGKHPEDRRPRMTIEAAEKYINAPTYVYSAAAANVAYSAYSAYSAYASANASADAQAAYSAYSAYASANAADANASAADAYASVNASADAYSAYSSANAAKEKLQRKIIAYGLTLIKRQVTPCETLND